MSALPDLAANAGAFQTQLIDWYDGHARSLPWREQPSLYKTVVSEFMLQQTQVKTVLPYFARWLEAFPDFETLAAAPTDSVLKRWEGLGYYSRARNLQRLSQQLVALEPARRPRRAEEWLRFPGVGPYAAAAICSIAFGEATAVVDGNVARVLARLSADETDFKSSGDAVKACRPLALALINRNRPGDHNQAMMELGATVCRKNQPQCLLCPVRSLCKAAERGIESSLPRLAAKSTERQVIDRAWVRGPAGLLLHRIPGEARRMRGMHELPTLKQVGLALPRSNQPLMERKRSITRYRITERFFEFDAESLAVTPPSLFWASLEEVESLPFSGPHRRWIAELLARDSDSQALVQTVQKEASDSRTC